MYIEIPPSHHERHLSNSPLLLSEFLRKHFAIATLPAEKHKLLAACPNKMAAAMLHLLLETYNAIYFPLQNKKYIIAHHQIDAAKYRYNTLIIRATQQYSQATPYGESQPPALPGNTSAAYDRLIAGMFSACQSAAALLNILNTLFAPMKLHAYPVEKIRRKAIYYKYPNHQLQQEPQLYANTFDASAISIAKQLLTVINAKLAEHSALSIAAESQTGKIVTYALPPRLY